MSTANSVSEVHHRPEERQIEELDQGNEQPNLLVIYFPEDSGRQGISTPYMLALDSELRVCLAHMEQDAHFAQITPNEYEFVRNRNMDEHVLMTTAVEEMPLDQYKRGYPFLGGGGNWGTVLGRYRINPSRVIKGSWLGAATHKKRTNAPSGAPGSSDQSGAAHG